MLVLLIRVVVDGTDADVWVRLAQASFESGVKESYLITQHCCVKSLECQRTAPAWEMLGVLYLEVRFILGLVQVVYLELRS